VRRPPIIRFVRSVPRRASPDLTAAPLRATSRLLALLVGIDRRPEGRGPSPPRHGRVRRDLRPARARHPATDVVFSAASSSSPTAWATRLLPGQRGASRLFPHRVTPTAAFEVIARHRPTLFCATRNALVRRHARAAGGLALRRAVACALRLRREALPPTSSALARPLRRGDHRRHGTTRPALFISTGRRRASRIVGPGRARLRGAIVDEEGRPVERGEIGNLRVKATRSWPVLEPAREDQGTLLGPWTATGDKYYQDETATSVLRRSDAC